MHLPELHTQAGQSVRLSRNSNPFNFLITEINRKKLIRLLFRVTGVLIVIHLINLVSGFPSWQMERLFALGEESNIPTWFSSGLWGLVSFAAYRCSRVVRAKKEALLWMIMAAVFLVFSIDEVAMIHESLFGIIGRYFPEHLRSEILPHFRASNWPIIAAPFLVLTIVWLIQVFKRFSIDRPVGQLILLGFFLVIFGGWGLEITTNFLNHNELQWLWEIESAFEESMEMFGAIMILSGLFKHHQFLNETLTNMNMHENKEIEVCQA